MFSAEFSLDRLEKIGQLYLWSFGALLAAERFKVSVATGNQQPIGVAGEHHLAVTFDQESFVRALDHLLTAHSRLSKEDRQAIAEPPADLGRVVKVLRNAYEHWPTERREGGRRREDLARINPNSEPWSLGWSIDTGITVAGVLHVEPTLVWICAVKDFAEGEARKLLPHVAWPKDSP